MLLPFKCEHSARATLFSWLLALHVVLGLIPDLLSIPSDSQSLARHSTRRTHPQHVITRYETLVVSMQELTVNCTYKRRSIVINGTSPGPVLRFNTYERIIINVTNQLVDQNFTMHWHGLAMAGSPWSDGTPMIAQWPIAPGDYFLYEFFPTADNVGTYFYHSHVGLQLSTAHGAMIISPACTDPKPEPIEKVLVLADYWYKDDTSLLEGLLSDPFGWTNSSNEIYLNGLSNGTADGAQCSTSFPVIDVKPSTTYRLRWIHAGSLMYISAGIQSHKMVLIEADGSNLRPFSVDHIEMGNAQRYSALLHTKSESQLYAEGRDGLYLIKLSSRWRNPGINNYAVLRYVIETEAPIPSEEEKYISILDSNSLQTALKEYALPNETYGWLSSSFAPAVRSRPPKNKNNTLLTLHAQQKQWGVKGVNWQVNGQSYYESNHTRDRPPYLIQFYQNLTETRRSFAVEKSPEDDIYEAFSDTYVLEAGQVIDIVIINEPGLNKKTEIHPWHLHGRKFWVLAAGIGNFNESSLAAGRFPTPYQRDTVNVYPGPASTISNETLGPGETGGWTLIRYEASAGDAGVFPMHCHISPHLVMGMAVIFTVSPSTLPTLLDSYKPYLQWRGEGYGNATWVPEEPHYFKHAQEKHGRSERCRQSRNQVTKLTERSSPGV